MPSCSLHILFLVGKGVATPFILTDLAISFKAHGHTVSFLPLQAEKPDTLDSDVKHDVIFTLDHAGFDIPWVQSLSGQRISWFVDNPFYFLNTCDPDIIVFSWDVAYIQQLQSVGFLHVYEMPLATNTAFFNSCSSDSRYVTDVSFVGSVASPDSSPVSAEIFAERGIFPDFLQR